MLKDEKNSNFVKNQNPYNKYKTIINNDILKLYYQFTHLKNIYRPRLVNKFTWNEI